jgi:aminoglycoside 3-N-acetyltransferase
MKKLVELSKLISGNIDRKMLQDYLEAIYQRERDFSFSSFKYVSNYCYNTLKAMGVTTEFLPIPFDGETRYGDWTMPMAWEAGQACLTLMAKNDSGEQLLADRYDISQHLIQWSADTPSEGIVADLIWIDKIDQISHDYVGGKFILTTIGVTEIKRKVAEAGGIGIISYGSRPTAPDNAVPWLNCWSDDPDGWVFTIKDKNLIGFSISNEQGENLRRNLLSGNKITLKAQVNAGNYKDTLPLVLAEIKGTGQGSVLLLAHLFEPGANDNASGAAALLEIARVISSLIKKKMLPQPRRTIKFLLTSEIYGTLSFLQQSKDEIPDFLAALNIDSIGRLDFKSKKMVIHQVPDSSLSFVSVFLEKLVGLAGLSSQIEFAPFSLADNVSTDPMIGIPCPHLGVLDECWHTSLDIPDTIDYNLLTQYTALSALYAYSLADAGKEEALWLVESLEEHIITQIQDIHKSIEKIEYFGFVSTNQLKSIADIDNSTETIDAIEAIVARINAIVGSVKSKIMKKKRKEKSGDKKQVEIVPLRRFTGPLSFLDIPLDERRKNQINMWNPVVQKAIFWIDGKRTLNDIINLTELEFGSSLPYLRDALNTLIHNRLLLEVITYECLINDLRKLGIKKGDKVGVHSSLKSLGHVIGGAETVINVLLDVIGPEGTLLMPLFNDPAPLIDLRSQPSRLGIIAETFRMYPGVVRSYNATHSVGVIGTDAELIAAGHEKGTQLGIDSPFHRLAKMGGWILHLGTNFNSSSIIHVAEAIAKVPYLDVAYPGYDITIKYIVEDGSQKVLESKEIPGDSITFDRVRKKMEKRGLLIKGKVGMGQSVLVKGKDILDVTLEMLNEDPGILLCDNNNCPVCPVSKKLVG